MTKKLGSRQSSPTLSHLLGCGLFLPGCFLLEGVIPVTHVGPLRFLPLRLTSDSPLFSSSAASIGVTPHVWLEIGPVLGGEMLTRLGTERGMDGQGLLAEVPVVG